MFETIINERDKEGKRGKVQVLALEDGSQQVVVQMKICLSVCVDPAAASLRLGTSLLDRHTFQISLAANNEPQIMEFTFPSQTNPNSFESPPRSAAQQESSTFTGMAVSPCSMYKEPICSPEGEQVADDSAARSVSTYLR